MMNNTILLQAGALSVTLAVEEGALSLAKIMGGDRCFFEGSQPLFRFLVAGREEGAITGDAYAGPLSINEREMGTVVEVASSDRWQTITNAVSGDTTTITLAGSERAPGVTILLQATCRDGEIAWAVSMLNSNEKLTVMELEYPAPSFTIDDKLMIFTPHHSGVVTEAQRGKPFYYTEEYPTHEGAMQYMAAYTPGENKKGLYFGIHDPRAAFKKMYCKNDDVAFNMAVSYYGEDITSGANAFSPAGRALWKLFDGDWYDATMIYRDFVMTEVSWLPKQKDGYLQDTPEWMLKMPHWWNHRAGNDDSYIDVILEAQADLGVPSGVHFYNWHEIPFDNDYPNYFPAKECFLSSFHKMQQAGMRVMPYINGRLWDTKDHKAEDYRYTKEALPGVTKKRDGSPYAEKYLSLEEDGSNVVLAVMCPSSQIWQREVEKIVKTLIYDIGVDAVYLDQIAAAGPKLCCDPRHNHKAGGGSWWVESYNEMIARIKAELPKDAALTTECNAEPFMKELHGLLSWMWVFPGQVPAFQAIYAGYTPVWGRGYEIVENGPDLGIRILAAQSLVFGEQMGWLPPAFYMQMKCRPFYRECVQTRYRYNEFFYNGEMLRPPHVKEGSMEKLTLPVKCFWYGVKQIDEMPVVFGLWHNRRTGQVLFLAINITEEEIETDVYSEHFTGGKKTVKLAPLAIYTEIL